MNVQISLSEIYYNYSLRNFFMREQAYNTLNELISKNGDEDFVLNRIDEYADECGSDFDEIEEKDYALNIVDQLYSNNSKLSSQGLIQKIKRESNSPPLLKHHNDQKDSTFDLNSR